ncbi:MAG: sulfotransferase [Anaerolineales bacterium]|nr:sulfotransferase [Anaerolineales bacterium]
MLSRIKSAMRVLIKGEQKKKNRNPIPSITKEEIAEVKQFFPREKFFILGHARSGTTLLMRLARLHNEVHCNYQAHFFTRKPSLKSLVDSSEIEEWLTRKSNRWNHAKDLSPLILRASADFILEREAIKENKNIVGDKSPSSNIHGQAVRDMHSIYPDAKLIYIVRDGRDVLISERFRNFVEESKFLTQEDKRIISDLKVDSVPFTSGLRSIFTESFIRNIAKRWADDVNEIDSEAKKLYKKNYLSLCYEDLLENPFDEMSKVWKFLGTKKVDKSLTKKINAEMKSNPDEQWQAERNEGIASFLPKGQAGNWNRLFTQKDKSIFKEIAGDVLIKWKYEESVDW